MSKFVPKMHKVMPRDCRAPAFPGSIGIPEWFANFAAEVTPACPFYDRATLTQWLGDIPKEEL